MRAKVWGLGSHVRTPEMELRSLTLPRREGVEKKEV